MKRLFAILALPLMALWAGNALAIPTSIPTIVPVPIQVVQTSCCGCNGAGLASEITRIESAMLIKEALCAWKEANDSAIAGNASAVAGAADGGSQSTSSSSNNNDQVEFIAKANLDLANRNMYNQTARDFSCFGNLGYYTGKARDRAKAESVTMESKIRAILDKGITDKRYQDELLLKDAKEAAKFSMPFIDTTLTHEQMGEMIAAANLIFAADIPEDDACKNSSSQKCARYNIERQRLMSAATMFSHPFIGYLASVMPVLESSGNSLNELWDEMKAYSIDPPTITVLDAKGNPQVKAMGKGSSSTTPGFSQKAVERIEAAIYQSDSYTGEVADAGRQIMKLAAINAAMNSKLADISEKLAEGGAFLSVYTHNKVINGDGGMSESRANTMK